MVASVFRVPQTGGISSIFWMKLDWQRFGQIVKWPENFVINPKLPEFRQLPENLHHCTPEIITWQLKLTMASNINFWHTEDAKWKVFHDISWMRFRIPGTFKTENTLLLLQGFCWIPGMKGTPYIIAWNRQYLHTEHVSAQDLSTCYRFHCAATACPQYFEVGRRSCIFMARPNLLLNPANLWRHPIYH